jgi:hypothetical protein
LVNTGDKFSLLSDLMNMNPQPQKVYVTMTYEYLHKKEAQGFSNVKPIWLDYDNCGTSDIKVPKKLDRFKLTAKPWTAQFNGDIVLAIGHVHDGGTHLTVTQNDKQVCDSVMAYGASPRYVEMSAFKAHRYRMNETMIPYVKRSENDASKAPAEDDKTVPEAPVSYDRESAITETQAGSEWTVDRAEPGMKHISTASSCLNIGSFKKGDHFVVTGYYDFQKHQNMRNDEGNPKKLMTISLMWAAVPMDWTIPSPNPLTELNELPISPKNQLNELQKLNPFPWPASAAKKQISSIPE